MSPSLRVLTHPLRLHRRWLFLSPESRNDPFLHIGTSSALGAADLKLELVAAVEIDHFVVEAGFGHFGLEVRQWGQEDIIVAA